MTRQLLVLTMVAACGGGHAATDASGGGDSAVGDGARDVGVSTDGDPSCANPGSIPPVKLQQVVTGLTQPLIVVQPPGSTDLYVVEKPGRIKIIRNSSVVATPFLDVSAEVNIPDPSAEGGLLGLAFAADYVTSGRFFIYLSLKAQVAPAKPTRVAVREYRRSANPDIATPTPVRDLIDAQQDGFNSLGGTITFGPDGALWLAMGDAAAMPSDAPTLTSRRGKMLRIDVDNPTVAPAGNIGGSADPYVWDYGLRNPYRFSFDRLTHELYIADAGDTRFEEVNVEPPNMGHRDYGWDRMEGMHCRNGTTSCGAAGTLPIYERAHEPTFSVIIGGYVYRGSMSCLRGRYIFSMFGVGKVLSFIWTGAAVTSETELTNTFSQDLTNLVGFGEDFDGELYFVTLSGAVYKLVPA
jgi:glucose/arabinose dehydrogenase